MGIQKTSVEDFNKAYDTDWAFEIKCRDCGQSIVDDLYMRDFDVRKTPNMATEELMAAHIIQVHWDDLYDDNDLDVPMD